VHPIILMQKLCQLDKIIEKWFLSNRRALPWRENRTPYRVWVSEVMLQQTQASTVAPYFRRWMKMFPTLKCLATASLEQVIKEWEGLGYYRRAKNLHETAKIIINNYAGVFPNTEKVLKTLPGIGSYTVGAILSFAFKKRVSALDINVLRVLSRFFGSPHKISHKNYYENLLLTILPTKQSWIVMEGLIELGAQICKKRPLCDRCPLQKECLAYRENKVDFFPIITPKPKTIFLDREVFIIFYKNEVLVYKEMKAKVMQWLYQFPYNILNLSEIKFPLGEKKENLPPIQHSFTKYRVTLFPSVYRLERKLQIPGFLWKSLHALQQLPFSAGHKKIRELVLRNYADVSDK
jgi:A/G-specific adenine glycosylase